MSNIANVTAMIRRRVLVNATAAPEDVTPLLPSPFRPQLVQGRAVVGVCLIRLEQLRPSGLPPIVGVATENMAHRIAVEWDDDLGVQTGVYIPVRHSASWLTMLLGGRVVPGAHTRAAIDASDDSKGFRFTASTPTSTLVRVHARAAGDVPPDSVFRSVADAHDFFEGGCRGFTPRRDGSLDVAELHTGPWRLAPLALDDVYAAMFHALRASSLAWDSAFVVRDVPCEWRLTRSVATGRVAPWMAGVR